MMPRTYLRLSPALSLTIQAVVCVALLACDDTNSPTGNDAASRKFPKPPPVVHTLRLVAMTSTTITGVAGSTVTPAPAVRVVNELDAPVSGVLVTFAMASATGTLVGASAVSDVEGTVRIGSWTLDTKAGSSVLRGRLESTPTVTVDFAATIHAGPASTIVRVTGNGQRGAIGQALPEPVSVRVTDAFDNPVGGVGVAFSVLSGDGRVSASATTNGDGMASAGTWTLGPAAGEQRLAAVVGGTQVEFTAVGYEPCPLPCAPGATFAFARNGDIHLANEDGSGIVRLTSDGMSWDPVWSPDGRQIAFTRVNGNVSDIMLIDADGSNVRRVVANASSPSWSPDGRQMAYIGQFDGTRRLLVIGVVDASGPTPIGFDRGVVGSPAWSPDGRRIAFVADWEAFDFAMEVYVVNPDGSDLQQVTNGFFGSVPSWPTYLTYYAPAWSPDGTRFAVTTCVEWQWASCTESSVAVMNIDGSGLRTLASTIGVAGPVWNDGWISDRTIAFTRTCRNSACLPDVFVMSADGGAEQLLIANAHGVARRP